MMRCKPMNVSCSGRKRQRFFLVCGRSQQRGRDVSHTSDGMKSCRRALCTECTLPLAAGTSNRAAPKKKKGSEKEEEKKRRREEEEEKKKKKRRREEGVRRREEEKKRRREEETIFQRFLSIFSTPSIGVIVFASRKDISGIQRAHTM